MGTENAELEPTPPRFGWPRSCRLVITMPTILVMGTLDTKGVEAGFLAEQVRANGCDTLVIDLGILGTPAFEPDVTRDVVAEAAGERIEELVEAGDRGRAVGAMTRGIEKIVPDLHARGRIDAVVGLGGARVQRWRRPP